MGWHEAARSAGAAEYMLKEDLDAVRRILGRGPPPDGAAEVARVSHTEERNHIMTNFKLTATSLLTLVFSVALTSLASAQVNRTYVSVEGSDANPCSERYPCRTFARALSLVAAKGEVIAVPPNQRTGPDNDGGFQPFTISKSVSIIGFPGAYTGVLATSLANAITITAGAADVVVIRGLTLNGISGGTAIRVNSVGALSVENCVINGFNFHGIDFLSAGKLFVSDTVIRNNGTQGQNSGIKVEPQSEASATASITHCQLMNNYYGITAKNNTTVSVRDSVIAGNANDGITADVTADTVSVEVNVDNCQVTGNDSNGISLFTPNVSSGAVIRVSNSTITDNNNNGLVSILNGQVTAGAGLLSRGNNTVEGNKTDGDFDRTFGAK